MTEQEKNQPKFTRDIEPYKYEILLEMTLLKLIEIITEKGRIEEKISSTTHKKRPP